MGTRRTRSITHRRKGGNGARPGEREIVTEAPVTIDVEGVGAYTIMHTPEHVRDLVVGFLFSEGMIRGAKDIAAMADCPDDPRTVKVRLAGKPSSDVPRNLVVSSSCGLCGRGDVEELVATLQPVGEGPRVPVSVLYEIPGRVKEAQELFRATGGTHAAALYDAEGTVRLVREDIGRHNALDKMLGAALLAGTRLDDCGVYLSGRVSLEMIAKAVRGRIPLVAAASAPTEAALEAAERLDVTVCGFVRGEEVTVYTHDRRLFDVDAVPS